MKKAVIILILLLCSTLATVAQNNSSKSGPGEGFKKFREQMLSDYHGFKQRILDQYADFLNGVWHPYEPLFEESRDSVPKPVIPPTIIPDHTRPKNNTPVSDPFITNKKNGTPEKDTVNNHPGSKTPDIAKTPDNAEIVINSPVKTVPQHYFDFYGMTLSMPDIKFNIMSNINSDADRATQFRKLNSEAGPVVAKALGELASELGLNGYLTLRLGEAYLNSVFPNADLSSKFSALHYLLIALGYDVRLGRGRSDTPVLLVPFEQSVAQTFYLNIDGRNYTSLLPDGMDIRTANIGQIYTCSLPADIDKGKKMNLRLNPLHLPFEEHSFDISYGKVHLSGVTNKNFYRMLYRYPLMPMSDFASSVLDPEVRENLIKQVREQLGNLPKDEAVNELLKFFHFAFEYATDTQNHGREKPYFIEETLYYDKNDCEDRAMMFSWLVWNALELPAHLNAYPGHESAAVAVESETAGDYFYESGGKIYRNTDPTFLGSHIGQIMPQFSQTPPKTEKTYPE